MIEGQKKLVFNWLLDFKKKEISSFERAKVIQEYLDSQKISQRELARQLDLPHNTLQDWLLWNNLTEKEYQQLLKKGLSDTDIYRNLREGKTIDKKKLLDITKLDTDLMHCIKKLKSHINTLKESSAKSTVLILDLQKILTDLLAIMKLNEMKK